MSALGTVDGPGSAIPRPRARGRGAVRLPAWSVLVAGLVVALVLVAALFPGVLTSTDPDAVDPIAALAPPGGGHLLGTDQLGRDVLARIIYGARPSLMIGVGATAIAVAAGSVLGILAATGGRVLDEAIMRLTDVFLAFPGLLLALVVAAVLGPGTGDATLAIGASLTPGFVRLARGQALVVKNADYVRSAVTYGRGRLSNGLRHLLPNTLPPLLVLASINIGTAVIAGSSLSFLGLGPKAPTAEWGEMLSDGRDFMATAWAMAVFPGVAITLTVVAVNVLGRDLRRRFEGREA
ncbi:ABC transporter permease [Streptomyces sp. NBC_00433]